MASQLPDERDQLVAVLADAHAFVLGDELTGTDE
jgi:hypothetical protein